MLPTSYRERSRMHPGLSARLYGGASKVYDDIIKGSNFVCFSVKDGCYRVAARTTLMAIAAVRVTVASSMNNRRVG